MTVEEVLKEIKSSNGSLELSIDHTDSDDVVIIGAVGESGLDRREFVLKKDEQNQFLEGLASIINNK